MTEHNRLTYLFYYPIKVIFCCFKMGEKVKAKHVKNTNLTVQTVLPLFLQETWRIKILNKFGFFPLTP